MLPRQGAFQTMPTPYAVVRCGGIEYRTDVCNVATTAPQWEAPFKFRCSNPQSDQLEVSILHKGSFSDTPLGTVNISLNRGDLVQGHVLDTWFQFPNSQMGVRLRILAHDFGVAPQFAPQRSNMQQLPPQRSFEQMNALAYPAAAPAVMAGPGANVLLGDTLQCASPVAAMAGPPVGYAAPAAQQPLYFGAPPVGYAAPAFHTMAMPPPGYAMPPPPPPQQQMPQTQPPPVEFV